MPSPANTLNGSEAPFSEMAAAILKIIAILQVVHSSHDCEEFDIYAA
jgi:S-adenosylmethionine hydrolase